MLVLWDSWTLFLCELNSIPVEGNYPLYKRSQNDFAPFIFQWKWKKKQTAFLITIVHRQPEDIAWWRIATCRRPHSWSDSPSRLSLTSPASGQLYSIHTSRHASETSFHQIHWIWSLLPRQHPRWTWKGPSGHRCNSKSASGKSKVEITMFPYGLSYKTQLKLSYKKYFWHPKHGLLRSKIESKILRFRLQLTQHTLRQREAWTYVGAVCHEQYSLSTQGLEPFLE